MTISSSGRATIEDVAIAAGVSVATVSRALRGLPNVAPSTRDRVLATASELAYVANPNASRLAAGRSRAVAMAIPVLNSWYFAQVVSGVEATLSANGLDLLLCGVADDAARARFLSGALQSRSDGLILVDLRVPVSEIEALASAGTSAVTVGFRTEQFPSVRIDDVNVAFTAVQHLIDLGHRNIGLISGLPDDPIRFIVPDQRREGYCSALRSAGIDPRPGNEVAGNFSIAGGREAMVKLLDLAEPPTAVFAMSDEMAMGAMMTTRERGLSVPGDVSIIGVDDHDAAEVVGLTTIAQAVSEHGSAAARLMLAQIADSNLPIEHVENSTELEVRNTTGPPRG